MNCRYSTQVRRSLCRGCCPSSCNASLHVFGKQRFCSASTKFMNLQMADSKSRKGLELTLGFFSSRV